MLTREKFINSPIEIEFELLQLLKQDDRLVIFDIGACEAEDSIRYANLFPKSTVYAFEPRTDNCKKAKELINQYKKTNIILENIALSNKNGIAEFYLSEGEPNDLKNSEHWDFGNKSSSLLPPSEEMKKHTDWLRFNNKTEVNTLKLQDYITTKKIDYIDFAHIDVQGSELMVLEGAETFLQKIKLIWLEVESVELYKNQPLKNDVERFMQKNNFINILDTVNNVSGDQLYVNKIFFHEKQLFALRKARKRSFSFISRIKSFFKS